MGRGLTTFLVRYPRNFFLLLCKTFHPVFGCRRIFGCKRARLLQTLNYFIAISRHSDFMISSLCLLKASLNWMHRCIWLCSSMSRGVQGHRSWLPHHARLERKHGERPPVLRPSSRRPELRPQGRRASRCSRWAFSQPTAQISFTN